MELEGLTRGLEYLDDSGLTVSELITDRHVQVKKYMSDKQPDKEHYFDVWHVAKGLYAILPTNFNKFIAKFIVRVHSLICLLNLMT